MQTGMDVDSQLPACAPGADTTGSQPEEELHCVFLLCQLLTDQKDWGLVSGQGLGARGLRRKGAHGCGGGGARVVRCSS